MPALSFVEARQTCGRSQFPGFAQLELRGSDRLTKAVLGSARFSRDPVSNVSSPLRRSNSAFWQSSLLLSAMARPSLSVSLASSELGPLECKRCREY